jgi:two-component system, sensor histidine kinase
VHNAPLPAQDSHALRGCVLLVEDNVLVRDSLQQTLRGWGLVCDAACDGEAALALLQQTRYDVVLSDWRLPGRWNGVQLLEHIRAAQPTIAATILMTGEMQASLGDIAESIAVLRKPVRPIRLRALLGATLHKVSAV